MFRPALILLLLGAPAAGCDLFSSSTDDAGADPSDSDVASAKPDLARARWQAMASGSGNDLLAVWGSGADDLYAVGARGTILHSTGHGTWSTESADTLATLRGVWGRGAGDVYAVGDQGVVLHSRGDGTWSALPSLTTAALHAIWGSGVGDIYAVGDLQTVIHSSGGAFQQETSQSGAAPFVAAWGSGAKDVFAVGRELWHSSGDGVWSPRVDVDHPTLYGMWGAGAEVYVVGAVAGDPWNGVILHSHAGGAWNESPEHPGQLRSVCGGSSGVIAAGVRSDGSGFLIRSAGDDIWTLDAITPKPLFAVFQSASGEAFAVGGGGAIVHAAP